MSSIPSFAIVGNDAVLAARPATPVQLAHACLAVGFRMAIPVSWGDELVAAESLRQLETHGRGPAIHCACPRVAERLLATGGELAPFLVSLVSPPAAAARYLRSLYERTAIRITYIGDCPGAADDAIDGRLLPSTFFDVLARQGIALADQPRVFDSVIPPDRRRFASLPGGLPAPEQLWNTQRRTLVTLEGEGYSAELAQHLIASECVLVDLAPRLGCACSGAGAGVPAAAGRAAVTALEPPRAPRSPIDTTVDLQLTSELPAPPTSVPVVDGGQSAATSGGAPRTSLVGSARPQPEERPGSPFRRRPTPTGFFRTPAGSVPQWRSGEGRALPRAYVGRRPTPVATRAVSDVASSGAPAIDPRLPDGSSEGASVGGEERARAYDGGDALRDVLRDAPLRERHAGTTADERLALVTAVDPSPGAPVAELTAREPVPATPPVTNGAALIEAEPPAEPQSPAPSATAPVRLTSASALEAAARRADGRRRVVQITLIVILALAVGAALTVFAERLLDRRPAQAHGPGGARPVTLRPPARGALA